MTDDEIRDVVEKYILDLYRCDNADCLHEMDQFDIPGMSDEEFEELIDRALAFYRQATVTVTFGEGS